MSGKFRSAAIPRALLVLFVGAAFVSMGQPTAQAQTFLTRHLHQVVVNGQARFLRYMSPTQTLTLNVVLPVRNQAGLDTFLEEVYDPSDPLYGHFLTAPEFTAQFGPTQAEYDEVADYLEGYGFKIVGGSLDAMDVTVVGTVTEIEAAFNVQMGIYQHPTESRTFYSPAQEPITGLPFPLWHVSGLSDYSIPRPAIVQAPSGATSAATTGSGPDSSFLGSDMRAAYYGGTALKGSGQNIGLLEYKGYDISDLNTYYSNVGQTRTATVTGISTDGTSLACVYADGCDDTEQIIDMTQSLGMAPGTSTLYVYVGSSDTAILGAMSSDSPLPAQLSSSWLWEPADPTTDYTYFEKMASQGQNFFQASGDYGSWPNAEGYYWPAEGDCVAVDVQDCGPIAVGGTDLVTESAGGQWESETAWSGSGGGISPDDIPIPSWQQLAGVINSSNEGSTTYRNAPDVAANANVSFYVCADQTTCTANVWGGTSFAAPMWAGYLALANGLRAANSCGAAPYTFGFINAYMYPMGVNAQSVYFHEITSGSNGMYSAVAGYNLVTGWGSPNGTNTMSGIAISTTCGSASASPTPSSVSFDSKGDAPVTEEDVLTNNGPNTLVLRSVQVTGSYFSLKSTTCSTYLEDGKTCVAEVTFAPSGCVTGETGQLTFSYTAGADVDVALHGTTTDCTLNPESEPGQ